MNDLLNALRKTAADAKEANREARNRVLANARAVSAMHATEPGFAFGLRALRLAVQEQIEAANAEIAAAQAVVVALDAALGRPEAKP